MKNTLVDLRDHLFETLQALKQPGGGPILEQEIRRATAVRLIADEIIETAKVEVGLRKLLKSQPASEFFGTLEEAENGTGQRKLGTGENGK